MGVERALILDFIFGRLRVIQSPTVSLKEGAVVGEAKQKNSL